MIQEKRHGLDLKGKLKAISEKQLEAENLKYNDYIKIKLSDIVDRRWTEMDTELWAKEEKEKIVYPNQTIFDYDQKILRYHTLQEAEKALDKLEEADLVALL